MESYNNPFSFASDADLMPFWNHSDFSAALGDHSSTCQLSSYHQPAINNELDTTCFKSQSTPTSVVDAAAPVNHHNHHPVEIIPPLCVAPPNAIVSSNNNGHHYHYNNQFDETHHHAMISEFNFPNPAHKWEHPSLPMMAIKTMNNNNSHQNHHHHHHPATSSSSSSSYSVELDEALSLAPEDEEEESHDAPFLIPSPPSSHPHHHSHQHHQHHPSSAHFLPPSPPSSNSSGVAVPVIESTSSLKNPQFKRLREEVYNEQTDMSIDCQEMTSGASPNATSSAFSEEEDPTGGFKLPASKSPIMEAMVVCALNGWGIDIVKNNRPTSTSPAEVVFRVFDFNRYYKISRLICSKQRPTDDLGSRIKSLRRWFVNFPKKRDRCENAFFLQVKPTIAKKVNEIIERNSRSMGLVKRSRKQ